MWPSPLFGQAPWPMPDLPWVVVVTVPLVTVSWGTSPSPVWRALPSGVSALKVTV